MNSRVASPNALLHGAVMALALLISHAGVAQENDDEPYVDKDAGALHDQVFLEENYPSAHTCGKCHPQQSRDWSVSPHASPHFRPVFTAFTAPLVLRPTLPRTPLRGRGGGSAVV